MYNVSMTAIRNPRRARQLIDFDGLQYENKQATDIDAVQEYEGIAYVLMEFKYKDAEVEHGQMRTLVTMCDDWVTAKKHVLFLIARHQVNDPEQPVIAAGCIVDRYRLDREWFEDGHRTVKEVRDWFLGKYGHHQVEKSTP